MAAILAPMVSPAWKQRQRPAAGQPPRVSTADKAAELWPLIDRKLAGLAQKGVPPDVIADLRERAQKMGPEEHVLQWMQTGAVTIPSEPGSRLYEYTKGVNDSATVWLDETGDSLPAVTARRAQVAGGEDFGKSGIGGFKLGLTKFRPFGGHAMRNLVELWDRMPGTGPVMDYERNPVGAEEFPAMGGQVLPDLAMIPATLGAATKIGRIPAVARALTGALSKLPTRLQQSTMLPILARNIPLGAHGTLQAQGRQMSRAEQIPWSEETYSPTQAALASALEGVGYGTIAGFGPGPGALANSVPQAASIYLQNRNEGTQLPPAGLIGMAGLGAVLGGVGGKVEAKMGLPHLTIRAQGKPGQVPIFPRRSAPVATTAGPAEAVQAAGPFTPANWQTANVERARVPGISEDAMNLIRAQDQVKKVRRVALGERPNRNVPIKQGERLVIEREDLAASLNQTLAEAGRPPMFGIGDELVIVGTQAAPTKKGARKYIVRDPRIPDRTYLLEPRQLRGARRWLQADDARLMELPPEVDPLLINRQYYEFTAPTGRFGLYGKGPNREVYITDLGRAPHEEQRYTDVTVDELVRMGVDPDILERLLATGMLEDLKTGADVEKVFTPKAKVLGFETDDISKGIKKSTKQIEAESKAYLQSRQLPQKVTRIRKKAPANPWPSNLERMGMGWRR